MISPEIKKKIKEIQIKTKRLLNSTLVGDSRTAQKGFGLEFDQLREYSQGDDIRFIDWKATARAQKFLVRQYFEERNRKIMLMLDCSGSTFFSSGEQRKYDLMAEVACILALVADYGNDYVGLVLFSDEINKVIPPRKGSKHVRAIMEAVLTVKPNDRTTNLTTACDWAARAKNMITFMISDFIDDDFERSLKIAARKNELIVLRCLDPVETTMPAVGLLPVVGLEGASRLSLDIANVRSSVNRLLHHRIDEQNKLFKKNRIDLLDLTCGHPFMIDIINFFRRRMMY